MRGVNFSTLLKGKLLKKLELDLVEKKKENILPFYEPLIHYKQFLLTSEK